MAADKSFAEFVHLVLSSEEILYDDVGDNRSRHVQRRCFGDHLNPLEDFSDRKFLVRYRFTRATVVSILLSLLGARVFRACRPHRC
ncbi:hypothetical protein HPB47_028514 [Ixodes persulcatus]|uniref:Uncharacterized protein n=1 Tax=Ixodes persulcatus TaxID=34615 RepID=A0AC60PUI3_IXOPE|nr:hypothetical protein HPB47_028514 [Ixodes persulcatus]